MEDMYEVTGHPRLRMAADYGPVRVKPDRKRGQTAIGSPFRRVARIEPHVPPNQNWVTDDFKEELEKRESFYTVVRVEYPGADKDPEDRGRFNVKKKGSDEADMWIALYEIKEKPS